MILNFKSIKILLGYIIKYVIIMEIKQRLIAEQVVSFK